MLIERITILDQKNKTANSFNFTDKINIITSQVNTSGKSSLLKSIYYCLGLDITRFPTGWDYKNMLFKINYQSNNKNGFIVRLPGDIFIVDNINMSLKDYSNWFQKLLNINIKLPLKKMDKLHSVYASVPLIMFYIDQDSSWGNELYKDTVNSSEMYVSGTIPKKIFECLLAIDDATIIELQEQKFEITLKKKNIDNQNNVLSQLQDNFNLQTFETVFDENLVKKEIKDYLEIAASLNAQIKTYKMDIYSQTIKLDSLLLEREEVKKILKGIENSYDNIEYKCKECNSHLTFEQSLRRMRLDRNRIDIQLYLKHLDYEISNLQNEINVIKTRALGLTDDHDKLLTISQAKQGEITLYEYINHKAEQNINNVYNKIKLNLSLESNKLKGEISNLAKQINKLKKQNQEKSVTMEKRFQNILTELSLKFPKADLNKYKFLKFDSLKNSGAIHNEVFVSLYVAYTRMLLEFSNIKIPFCLDGFIKDEIDDDIKKNFCSIIEKYIFSSNHQVFIAMLKDKLAYIDSQKYNIIEMSGQVLSENKYLELEKEFTEIL